MEKKNYGNTLRNLLTFSEIKFLILGNHLGYDVSYISKWCSGVKLPSPKSIKEINEKISDLVSSEIISLNKENEFFNKFNIEKPRKNISINSKILVEKVYNLLNSSYLECSSYEEKETPDLFLIENTQIKSLLNTILRQQINEADLSLKFYMTLDITTVDCLYIISLLSKMKPENLKIKIYLGIHLLDDDNKSIENIKQIYMILNQFVNINFELYNSSYFEHLNTIIIKGKIAFIYSLNNDGKFETLISTTNKYKIKKLLSTLNKSMNSLNRVFSIKDHTCLIKKAYRTNFYTHDNFNFLLTTGFEFLISQDIIQNILNYALKKNFSKSELISMQDLMITWNEMFEKASINFFVFKSSILKYFQEKTIYFMNVEYKMTPDEILKHYNYFISALKSNPKIKIYVIDDNLLNLDYLDFKISVFCNKDSVFLKNIVLLSENKEDFLSTVNNYSTVRHINLVFNKLKNSKFCKEFSIEEIENSWEKYNHMILKIMNLHS